MRKSLGATLIALLVAAIWGYFADLSDGQVGWFIGRLVFCGSIAFVGAQVSQRPKGERQP